LERGPRRRTRQIDSGAPSWWSAGYYDPRMSPLFRRRRELEMLAARERAGESLWTSDFPPATRVRVHHAMDDVAGSYGTPFFLARQQILREEGKYRLHQSKNLPERTDFVTYLHEGDSDDVATAIEAYHAAVGSDTHRQQTFEWDLPERFSHEVNRILREDRVAFELVEGEMVPFSSRELHVEIVTPTLRLIAQSGWESVESAYQDALKQLSQGNAPNAITDAGTALQEALVKCGATGNALGPLIQSARASGLLASHDVPMAEALRKVADWVSADRSVSGDTHNSTPAEVEDAWLIVHVVGALVLRLSGASPRA
jgi:hypothetical protein